MAAAGRETGTAGAMVQLPLPTAPECAKPSESSCGDGSAEADGVGEAEGVAEADGEAARLADARAEDWAVALAGVEDWRAEELSGRAKPGWSPQARSPTTIRASATTKVVPYRSRLRARRRRRSRRAMVRARRLAGSGASDAGLCGEGRPSGLRR